MYKIREAKVEDFSMIAAINNIPNNVHIRIERPISKKYFEQAVAANDTKIYAVEKSGVIAAFVLVNVIETEQTISIEKFCIEKSFEKKGLDAYLYHKVERLAVKKQIKQMITSIQVDNPAVYDFFERKGWKRDGQEDLYYLLLY